MDQRLKGQQLVTLLLYFNDICIIHSDVDAMLDWVELVFSRLKSFQFKMKPKKCHFLFLGHVLSADGISANPEKVDEGVGLYLRMPRSYSLSPDLQPVTGALSRDSLIWPSVYPMFLISSIAKRKIIKCKFGQYKPIDLRRKKPSFNNLSGQRVSDILWHA